MNCAFFLKLLTILFDEQFAFPSGVCVYSLKFDLDTSIFAFFRQENQRRAIRESLMAAQQYCSIATCRRNFLLGYFGERFHSDKCGLSFTWFYSLNLLNSQRIFQ